MSTYFINDKVGISFVFNKRFYPCWNKIILQNFLQNSIIFKSEDLNIICASRKKF